MSVRGALVLEACTDLFVIKSHFVATRPQRGRWDCRLLDLLCLELDATRPHLNNCHYTQFLFQYLPSQGREVRPYSRSSTQEPGIPCASTLNSKLPRKIGYESNNTSRYDGHHILVLSFSYGINTQS